MKAIVAQAYLTKGIKKNGKLIILTMLAKTKYKVIIEEKEVNWVIYFINLVLAAIFLFYWGEWSLRNNYLKIITLDGGIKKIFDYSVHYQNVKAKKRIIKEDLNNLSVDEFEEKYELKDKPMKEKEPKFKIEELD